MAGTLREPFPLSSIFSFTSLLVLLSIFFLSCYSIDEQGQALLAWRDTLNDSSNALLSWNFSDQNPCSWFGIYCDSHGNVKEIRMNSVDLQGPLPCNFQPLKSLSVLVLSSTNLTGIIPKVFGDYLGLVNIDLSDNAISGEIPAEICQLSKLQTLYLNTNFFQGSIPLDIGNLSSVKHIKLFDNQLSGKIPGSIGKLTNLEIFRTGGNRNLWGELPREIGNCTNLFQLGLAETGISGNLPPSIGKLKTLQMIAIYTTQLSGPIPEEIGNCTELQHVYLYQNSITGSIPWRISELKQLRSLWLWHNTITGTIPSGIGKCMNLKSIDLSENLLTGSIPTSFGSLSRLEELQLSINHLSGIIPSEITNCTALTYFEVDNNGISGEIPPQIGQLSSLTLFFAWKNNLTGIIPESLAECEHLQDLDLSFNQLVGPVPKQIFKLTNLTKLLLLSNNLTGFIPPDIGHCTNLYRFRISDNKLGGTVPSEIGMLKNLNFLDMSNNQFAGGIPPSISGCNSLEFLDLHSNYLTGSLPDSLPKSLQLVDISDNRLTGSLSPSIGFLPELTKLNLRKNQLSAIIPADIISCRRLQYLDLSNNGFSGDIPKELGQLQSLEISVNLSCNKFTGEIPTEFSGLNKLGVLDISYNKISGKLDILTSLQNLVFLNVSFNEFSGDVPNTAFFRSLPASDLEGNSNLYISGRTRTSAYGMEPSGHARTTMKLILIIVSASLALMLLAIFMLVRNCGMVNDKSLESNAWEMALYQKLEFSIDDIVRSLISSNVIGTGSSGVVYKVTMPGGEVLAVKKMWSLEESGSFSSEIQTLGSIRHKNIVRLLGWGSNQTLKLLFYDYLPNGSLSSLLHGARKGQAEWETRYEIVLGIAHALSYLHHDCIPPIIHGDVKAMNVLLGAHMEPYLADFGLARVVSNETNNSDISKHSQRPHLAGSYGYMAPEHASMQRISEKSDVYSFGVILLEVMTGLHPLDPTLPGGSHMVQFIRDHFHKKGDPVDVLDQKLRGRADPQMNEMQQTLAVAFLCLCMRTDDRPMMKDVVAMLKEIRHIDPVRSDPDLLKGSVSVASPERVISHRSSICSFASFDDSA